MSFGSEWNHWYPHAWSVQLGDAIGARSEVGASRWCHGRFFQPSSMCCAPGVSGRHYRRRSAAPALSMRIFNDGVRLVSSAAYGERAWRNMTRWRGSLGNGRVWMARKAKLRWLEKRWETTPPIGEKKGTKRSLLVDGSGAPLSLIVSGANRHDVKLLAATLDEIVVRRPKPTRHKRQHLCADKAYSGRPAAEVMHSRGYTPHVRQIGREPSRRRGRGRARRWVVERTHSWFNRFRKLLVRYEKKEANFMALLQCAAALICWRMA